MIENIPNRERIPTREEILEMLYQIADGESLSIRRELLDVDGPYLIEVMLADKTPDGFSQELSFSRKGDFGGNKSIKTSIHRIYFDSDGFPVGGTCVSEFKNGQWRAM